MRFQDEFRRAVKNAHWSGLAALYERLNQSLAEPATEAQRRALQLLHPMVVSGLANHLRHLPACLRDNREIVLAAVQQNGLALEFADPALRANREIALAAVRRNGYALRYVDRNLQTDPEILLTAARNRRK